MHKIKDIAAVSPKKWGELAERIDENFSEVGNASDLNTENKTLVTAVNELKKSLDTLNIEVFPVSATLSGGGLYKKGTSNTVTITYHVYKGEADVTNAANVTINGSKVTGGSSVYRNVTINTNYNMIATYLGIKVSKTVSARFCNPSYFGVVPASFVVNPGNVSRLSEILKESKNLVRTVNLNNEKVCYAYPAQYGALTHIDNKAGDYITSYTKYTIALNGEQYFVYLLTDEVTVSDLEQGYR